MRPFPSFIFLSTNPIWGGSEVLWSKTLAAIHEHQIEVAAATFYGADQLQQFTQVNCDHFDLKNRFQMPSRLERVSARISNQSAEPKDLFKDWLEWKRPSLLVISQGNNTEGLEWMRLATQLQIPFVTLTHLVVEGVWPGLSDSLMLELIRLYESAAQNYFVSDYVRKQHERLLAASFFNTSLIDNPFTKSIQEADAFPAVQDGIYRVALIGRLEAYHKGLDILIEVIRRPHWQARPIHFSLYGTGPHVEWLKRMIHRYALKNVRVHDHVERIDQIWRTHHLLAMPSRMEGQSLTLLESMHFARPAVLTQVGGVDQLVEDGMTGFVCEYPHPDAFDQALERAWHARADWEQMGLRAQQRASLMLDTDPVTSFKKKLFQLAAQHTA